MQRLLSQVLLTSTALAAAADRFNGNPATDVYKLSSYGHICFQLHQGAGATGTATITIEACSAADGSNPEAIAFSYRKGNADGTSLGDLTAVTSAGYTTTAAEANKIHHIEVDAEDLPEGKPFVRMQLTEVANDPVAAAVIAILSEGRYLGNSLPTAVS